MIFKQEPTNEQLKRLVPSMFAQHASEKTSNQYLYIPTYKIVEKLTEHGFNLVGAKQQGTRKQDTQEFAKHVVYMSRQPVKDLALYDETAMVALTNSHNAGSSFQLDTSIWRKVCANGLMLPSQSLNSARVVHKIGMQNEVIDAAYHVVNNFDDEIKSIQSMKQQELSTDEQMLLAESARNLVFDVEQIELNDSKGIDLRAKLLTTRRYDDRSNDLWTTFNKIQENIIRGGLKVLSQNDKGDVSYRKMRQVKSIDRDKKLNQELMSLAIKFSELKAA